MKKHLTTPVSERLPATRAKYAVKRGTVTLDTFETKLGAEAYARANKARVVKL